MEHAAAPHVFEADDDLLALDIAMKMMEHISPFGHILSLLHELLGGLHELEIEGLAALALGAQTLNINPKHALDPALAYMFSTAAWKSARPAFVHEFESRKGRRGPTSARRALPLAKPFPR
jgi:hypothetical protein